MHNFKEILTGNPLKCKMDDSVYCINTYGIIDQNEKLKNDFLHVIRTIKHISWAGPFQFI